MDAQADQSELGHGWRRGRELIIHKRNRWVSRRTVRERVQNPMDRFERSPGEARDVHARGFFVISTLVLLTWLLAAALFWYTDIERSTERLTLEILAIRFESHLMVAKQGCRTEAQVIAKPTGTIFCRPLGPSTTEVEIRLKTGEKHKEVIYFDD